MDYSKYSNVYDQLMAYFQPPLPFKVKEYYGVSMYKRKRNGKYALQLIYDYTKSATMSKNTYIVDTCEEAIQIYGILDWFSCDKSDIKQFKIDIKEDNEWNS